MSIIAVLAACDPDCRTSDQLLAEADPGDFTFHAVSDGASELLQECVPASGSVVVRATERVEADLLLARADSEFLQLVTSDEGSVTRVPIVDDRTLVICAETILSPEPIVAELCALATPGPERKVTAQLLRSSTLHLGVDSDGSNTPSAFLSYATFMDACVQASRRACAPSRFTPEECVSASVEISDCAAAQAEEIGAAFECEAACGEGCADPCGVLTGLLP